MGFANHINLTEKLIAAIRSGKIQAVDLNSGNNSGNMIDDNTEKTNEEKLAAIDNSISAARKACNEAAEKGDDEGEKKWRSESKRLRKEKKVLKAAIENEKVVDDGAASAEKEAKIAKLKARIVEIKAAAEIAFENEDDDEEERLSEEARLLQKELNALGGSKRAKIEQAKKINAKLNDDGAKDISSPGAPN